jgi:hypothetical protein
VTRHERDDERLGLLLACGLILAAMLPCGPAEGQREDPALDHARACVGELGWRAPDDACAAIVEVHVRRGVRARSYSAALRRPPRHRAWVPQLDVGRAPPMAWPRALPWARHERRFVDVLEVVRQTLAAERPEACPGAMHYGGLMDATPAGHVEVCRWTVGRGAQVFFAPEGGER